MAASKRQRIDEIMQRLANSGPFPSGIAARAALEQHMRAVEDELSGISENPNAAATAASDGRMYPPDERFEIRSGSPRIRVFRQRQHRTWIGDNGAIRINSTDGRIEIDLPGAVDGKNVSDLLSETDDESH